MVEDNQRPKPPSYSRDSFYNDLLSFREYGSLESLQLESNSYEIRIRRMIRERRFNMFINNRIFRYRRGSLV